MAAHVFAPTTVKSKKLLILHRTRQLKNAEAALAAAIGSDTPAPTDMAQLKLGYDPLFSLARERFA